MWMCKPLFFVLSSLVFPDTLVSADSGPVKIAAWNSWIGQRVAFQEPETGDIRYSLCNSDVPEIPTGPHDRNIFHALQEVPPRMGTALVGLCYRWPQNISIAGSSIFYQCSESPNFTSFSFSCDKETGYEYKVYGPGDWMMNHDVHQSEAGLTMLVGEDSEGEISIGRKFYRDQDRRIVQGRRGSGPNTTYSFVSQLPTQSDVLTAYAGAGGISAIEGAGATGLVVAALVAEDVNKKVPGAQVQLARFNPKTLKMDVRTLPAELPGMEEATNETSPEDFAKGISEQAAKDSLSFHEWHQGGIQSIGLAHRPGSPEKDNDEMSLWYIGVEGNLHEILLEGLSEVGEDRQLKWTDIRGPEDTWPKAHHHHRALAVVSDRDTDTISIFYFSSSCHVVQVQWAGGEWKPSRQVTSEKMPGCNEWFWKKVPWLTVGIAGGCALLVLVILVVAICVVCRRRRRRRDGDDTATMSVSFSMPTPRRRW